MSLKAQLLLKGSFLKTIGFVFNIVVSFLLMPFIISSLGDWYYGLWVVMGSMIGYYWMADLGVGAAIERYIAKEIEVKDSLRDERINVVFNTGFFIFSIAGLIILGLSVILCYLLPFFMKTATDRYLFRAVFIIMGLSFALTFPLRAYSGLIRAFLRFDVSSITEIIIVIVRAVLTIIVLTRGGGIIGLAIITLVVDLCSRGVDVYYAHKTFPALKLSRKFIRPSQMKNLYSYGFFTFVSQIATQLRFNVDNLVIAGFMGLSFVTPYSIASRLTNYFRKFIGTIFNMTMPLFSQLEGINDFDQIRRNFFLLMKFNIYLSTFISGVLICIGKNFIIRWMGQGYPNSYPVLIVLTLALFIALLQRTSLALLMGISKQKFCAGVDIFEGVTNLVLSIILVFKFGLIGVAWGTVIPSFIAQIIILPSYVCKQISVSLKDYYLRLLISVIKAAVAIVIPYIAFKALLMPSYLELFSFGIIQSITFVILIYMIGFSREERNFLKTKILSLKKSV